MEDKKYTEDGSEIVWQSTLTYPMVRDLSLADRESLIDELNDAVAETCQMWEVDNF